MITFEDACKIGLEAAKFIYIRAAFDLGNAWGFTYLNDNGQKMFLGPFVTIIDKTTGTVSYWDAMYENNKYPTSTPVEIPLEYAYKGRTKWWENTDYNT